MSQMDSKHDGGEASFEGLVDFASVPPPAGEGGSDVHAARTAVATLPASVLEELKRGRKDDALRTRKMEPFDLSPDRAQQAPAGEDAFTDEAPTAPGRDAKPPAMAKPSHAPRPRAPSVIDDDGVVRADHLGAAITAAITAGMERADERQTAAEKLALNRIPTPSPQRGVQAPFPTPEALETPLASTAPEGAGDADVEAMREMHEPWAARALGFFRDAPRSASVLAVFIAIGLVLVAMGVLLSVLS